jgi:hypothetical protein
MRMGYGEIRWQQTRLTLRRHGRMRTQSAKALCLLFLFFEVQIGVCGETFLVVIKQRMTSLGWPVALDGRAFGAWQCVRVPASARGLEVVLPTGTLRHGSRNLHLHQ